MDFFFFLNVLKFRHEYFSGYYRKQITWHTSLRTGATERPDGSYEDDEGNKSSHSDADDHRHRQWLCREQSERGGRPLLLAANVSNERWQNTHTQRASQTHISEQVLCNISGNILSGKRPWKMKRKRRKKKKKKRKDDEEEEEIRIEHPLACVNVQHVLLSF